MNGMPILPPPPTDEEQFVHNLLKLGRLVGEAMATPEKGKATSPIEHVFNLWIQMYLSAIVGGVLVVIGILYLIFPLQFSTAVNWMLVIPPLLSIPLLIFLGGLLYKVRRNAPLLYGATECSVGIMTISVTVLGLRATGIDSVNFLKIVGGLYIIVRGLDNIGKYSKYIGFARNQWNRLFGPEYL